MYLIIVKNNIEPLNNSLNMRTYKWTHASKTQYQEFNVNVAS